jgi:beta-glucosidase
MEYPDAEGMMPQLLGGHEQGYQAIKAERSDLQTGVTLSIADFEPGGEGSPYQEIRHKAYGFGLMRLTAQVTTPEFRYITWSSYLERANHIRLCRRCLTRKRAILAAMQRAEALKHSVEYIHAETNKPVFVTENGIETDNDQRRICFIDQSLAGLRDAIADGVPVLGYVHSSLLDNYEFSRGYKPKYGLVEVDRVTFKRTPKPSARHLGAIAARNAI